MVETISRSLQRYYDKREEINERQKKYFREKYYHKNRAKLIEYQNVKRQLGKHADPTCIAPLMAPYPIYTNIVTIEKNILVKF